MTVTMATQPLLDPTEPAVALRLARLLEHHRKQRGWSRRDLARLSEGAWTSADLKAVEAGRWPLDQATLGQLAALYEADVTAILPVRTAVMIDQGLVSIGGLASAFEPGDVDSLLSSYLMLVRRMRGQERIAVVDLRRSDVETLSAHLDVPGEQLVVRLGELMGVTAVQRRAMSQMFTTGMAVIVLTAGVIGGSSLSQGGSTAAPASTIATTLPTTVLEGISAANQQRLELSPVDESRHEWVSPAIDDLDQGVIVSPAVVTTQAELVVRSPEVVESAATVAAGEPTGVPLSDQSNVDATTDSSEPTSGAHGSMVMLTEPEAAPTSEYSIGEAIAVPIETTSAVADPPMPVTPTSD